jgi:hypothetical protein
MVTNGVGQGRQAMKHLSGIDDEALAALLRAALHDEAPPRQVLERAIALRSPARQWLQEAGSALRQLVALAVAPMTGDGFVPAPGLRGGAGQEIQTLFRAQECEIDLRLLARPDGHWKLRGQLFGLPAHTAIRLQGPAIELSTEADAGSEFAFDDLPPGAYRLALAAGALEVVIPNLELGHAAAG